MAYVLGFFAADGYMTVNKRGGHFWNMQINDLDLLLSIRQAIKSDHKISVKIKKKKEQKISYRLQVGSKEMYEDLYKLGMRQNKTRSLVTPSVPDEYFSHFIRGYFDGDGSVWMGYVHKNRKTKLLTLRCVFTSCSKPFLEGINGRLNYFSVKRGVLRKGRGDYYTLVFSVLNSLKLHDFMYNGGVKDLFLARKKEVFEKFIKMRL